MHRLTHQSLQIAAFFQKAAYGLTLDSFSHRTQLDETPLFTKLTILKTLSLPDWHYRASPSTAQHNNGPNAACPGQPEWKHSADLESLPSTGHTPEHDASSRQNGVETLRKCVVLERSLTLSNDSKVESPNQKPLFYWEDGFLLVLMGLRHYLPSFPWEFPRCP